MTYARVCDLFAEVFARRAGAGSLFHLDRVGLSWLVTTDGPTIGVREWHPGIDPDAALAPSVRDLRRIAPRSFEGPEVVVGADAPVAYLFEAISGATTTIGELTPDHMAAGAVERALAWVW